MLLNSLSSLNPNDMSQKSRGHIICCLLSVWCLAGTATAGTGLRLVVTCEGFPLTTGPCPDHALTAGSNWFLRMPEGAGGRSLEDQPGLDMFN